MEERIPNRQLLQIHLFNVGYDEGTEIAELVANLLRERGYGGDPDNADAPLRSIVSLQHFTEGLLAGDEASYVRQMTEDAQLIIFPIDSERGSSAQWRCID